MEDDNLYDFYKLFITELDFSGRYLTELPDLFEYPNLTHLFCYQNQLISLPDLSQCKNLTYLDCYQNQLTSLPDLSKHKNLTHLSCSNNKLNSLPDLSQCKNLRYLCCSHNKLNSLPYLSECKKLTYLYCYENQLTGLPDLSECKNVITLCCSDNKLNSLPDLSECKNFKELIMCNNSILRMKYPKLRTFHEIKEKIEYIDKINERDRTHERLKRINQNNVLLEIYEQKMMHPKNIFHTLFEQEQEPENKLTKENSNININDFMESYVNNL